MSVWVTAILPHSFDTPTLDVANSIAGSFAPNGEVSKWCRASPENGPGPYTGPEEQWEREPCVTFDLPQEFGISFFKSVVELYRPVRWSHFLGDVRERHDFLFACGSIAQHVGAPRLMVILEGTQVHDLLYDGITFDEAASEATKLWGNHDLDLKRIYSEHEVKHRWPRYYLGSTEELQAAVRMLQRSPSI